MIGFEMEQDYVTFNKNDINTLGNLNYNFVINDRYVHVKDDENNYFTCQTPFLKIFFVIWDTFTDDISKRLKFDSYILINSVNLFCFSNDHCNSANG